MIDERMLNIVLGPPVAELPFFEKLSHAVAYFCVYEGGDAITGAIPGVVMCWLDGDRICRRFAYIVEDEPLSFPGDGDKVFQEFLEAQRAAGRLHDWEAEIPEHISERFRARRKQHICNSSPLLEFEEVIARAAMEDISRVLEQLDVAATINREPERECVDGTLYRVLIKTVQGDRHDFLWTPDYIYDERGNRLGQLCHAVFTQAWEHGSKPSDTA